MMDVNQLVSVFEPDQAAAFTIDMVQVTVRPLALPAGVARPPTPLPAAVAALEKVGKVTSDGGERLALFKSDDLACRFVLGTRGNVAASFQGNVHRRVRAALVKACVYPASRGRDEGLGDNFIDPRLLAAPVDLHDSACRILWELIAECQAIYRAKFEQLYGAPVERVSATLTQVELTWDRPTFIAKAAPSLWWWCWRDTFPGAARTHHVGSRREVEAGRGAGELRADSVKGGGVKLYPKTERLLRFEAELTRERSKDMLKRPLRLDSLGEMRDDLEALAAAPYARLLDAQQGLAAGPVLDLAGLVDLFGGAGRWSKVSPIFRAFWSGAHFHNVAERHSKELTRLRKVGAARYVGYGFWSPGPAAARTFHVAQVLARHAEAA